MRDGMTFERAFTIVLLVAGLSCAAYELAFTRHWRQRAQRSERRARAQQERIVLLERDATLRARQLHPSEGYISRRSSTADVTPVRRPLQVVRDEAGPA